MENKSVHDSGTHIRMLEEDVEDHAHTVAMPLVIFFAMDVQHARPEAGAEVVLEMHVLCVYTHVALPLEEGWDVVPQGTDGSAKIDLEVGMFFSLLLVFGRSHRPVAQEAVFQAF